MKKLLGVLIASALFVPAMAANIFNNVETYGEIQTIGSLTENAGNASSTRDVSNRVLVGLGLDLVEDVRANVTFLNTSYWGTANGPFYGESVQNYLDETLVQEANVTISNVFGALDVKVGRQFYGDENSSVLYFGPTHYRATLPAPMAGSPSYTALMDSFAVDGVSATYNGDKAIVTFLYAKLSENLTNTNDHDVTVTGVDTKISITNNLLLQAYMYDFRAGTQPSKQQHDGFWGVKPTYTNDVVTVSVEGAKAYQDQIFGYNDRGWLLKADAKLNLAYDYADLSPRFTFARAEKGFMGFGNYLPGLIFSNREGQVFTGEDAIEIINLGADYKFAYLNKVSFALDYFAIKTSNNNGNHTSWLGNEFDLMAKYAVNEYVELHAGVGYMTNVKQGFAYNNNDPYTGQLGMLIKF